MDDVQDKLQDDRVSAEYVQSTYYSEGEKQTIRLQSDKRCAFRYFFPVV